MPARSFEDVEVWKKAHVFVLDVYRLSEQFPKHELYGLTSQFRRAAVSIPANIAEGFGKATKPDKLRFYSIAQGSVEECRYYLILARDLDYGGTGVLREKIGEVSKMLGGYMSAIKTDSR
jgi:four helix bundle protein